MIVTIIPFLVCIVNDKVYDNQNRVLDFVRFLVGIVYVYTNISICAEGFINISSSSVLIIAIWVESIVFIFIPITTLLFVFLM